MDRATFERESALNRRAYEAVRDQVRREHRGKYVALARGKIIGAADSFDAARALVERLDPFPEYYLVFPAEKEPDFGYSLDLNGGG